MSGYIQSNQIITLRNANSSISAVDSGKIMITPQTAAATDITLTLPTIQAGLHYRFINGSAGALSGNVIITAGATVLNGSIINGPTNGVELISVGAMTTIRFVTALSVLGDYIDLYCDGTSWYVDAKSSVSQAITVA